MTVATVAVPVSNLRIPLESIGTKGAGGIQVAKLAVFLPCGYCGAGPLESCHIMNPPYWDTRIHKTRMEPLWDLWNDGKAKGRRDGFKLGRGEVA